MSGKQGKWCRKGVNGGVCEGERMVHNPGDVPLTLTKCHSCVSQVYEALVWKCLPGLSVCQVYRRKFLS